MYFVSIADSYVINTILANIHYRYTLYALLYIKDLIGDRLSVC